MRVFITGGTGFVGRKVCEALAGHELLLLVRAEERGKTQPETPWRTVVGNLDRMDDWKGALRSFRAEACIHTAWEGLPDYSVAACVRNLRMSLSLFNVLSELDCRRVVVSGSCWEYGNLIGCVSEDQVPESQNQLAAYKTALRIAGESLFAATNTALLWARIFFAYGPAQRRGALIPSSFQALVSGSRPEIQNPDAINDFIHIDDAGAGLAALATSSAPPGVYNLGSGRPSAVRNIVNLVARALNLPDVFPASTESGRGLWAEASRIRNSTDWRPKVSLEDGVRRTVEAWRHSE